MEAFGKVMAVLFSVFILFLAPLLYMAQKQDAITQNYVLTETVRLADAVKNNGYLTSEMYETYLRKLHSTNNVYEISLSQARHIVAPKVDEATQELMEGVEDHYINTYTDAILEELDQNGVYYFGQGDYISMKVHNKNKTFGVRVMEALLMREISPTQIYVTYGGVIRDENY